MRDGIETFHYQCFIPEENRGGTYHTHIMKDGKIVGPLTPKQSDAMGYKLNDIFADINAAMLEELNATKALVEPLQNEVAEKTAALTAMQKVATEEIAKAQEFIDTQDVALKASQAAVAALSKALDAATKPKNAAGASSADRPTAPATAAASMGDDVIGDLKP